MGFKKDFIWGAATAAYQIEGAAFDDSKGLSICDVFKKHIRRVILDRGKGVSKQRFAVYARDNEKRGAVRAARQMISLQLRNERV